MRQTARHLWIGELLQGDYEEKEGWEPNVLHCARGDVVRCNLVGTILSMNEQQILDDGTGQISLKAFDVVPGLNKVKSGEIVQVVGRPRVYNDSLFVVPELVKAISPEWALVRKNELGELKQYVKKVEPVPEVQQAKPENSAEHLVAIITELDHGDGVNVDDVISKSGLGESAEKIISQLLLDGEVFEIKPGVVKVL